MSTGWKPVAVGQKGTPAYRIFIERDGRVISPFHDIPLFANEEKTVMNMIVEIPRWTNAKIEIATREEYNPLKQDSKKGRLRFVHNCFPYKGYIWNYGALPQTWEDPNEIHPETGARGDNDPVDVCEIGSNLGYAGEVKQVKVLGALGLLDDGETDWKMIAIDTKDPMASKVNDIHDVEREFPGLLDATRRWLKIYKIPDGKPANKFAFKEEYKDQAFAKRIVSETHEAWHRLIGGKTDQSDLSTTSGTILASSKVANPLKAKDLHIQELDDGGGGCVTSAWPLAVAPSEKGIAESDDDPKWHYINL